MEDQTTLLVAQETHPQDGAEQHSTADGAPAGEHSEHAPDAAVHAARGADAGGGEHAANAAHADAAPGHGAFHSHAKDLKELPHGLFFISEYLGKNGYPGAATFIQRAENTMYSGLIVLLVTLVLLRAAKKRMMIPGRLQTFLEMLVEGFDGLLREIMGDKHGRLFLPFLGSLFFFILFNNWLGLIPLFKAPTSAYSTTLPLALMVFISVQLFGMYSNGPLGYIYHLMGSPRSVIEWLLVPMMFPLHVIGELIKPLSLSLRLMGNIMGEDILLMVFAVLGVGVASVIGLSQFTPIPLQFPFLFMSCVLGAVQAFLFMLLTAVYFMMMAAHDEHEHEAGEQH